MSSLGFKSVIYHGDLCLGEAQVLLSEAQDFQFPNNEIRINHLSAPSERCLPLSILQTISPFTVRCKLEVKPMSEQSPLNRLYVSCLTELKTAVVLLGDEELHLVAMQSRVEPFPCFWCCTVPLGLYASCLGMLNLRCLAIVFDLDETLIVANTMKSFEDRIEFLQRRITCESDAFRASAMKTELKRYSDDKALLKQYLESDHVMDNGKLIQVQLEEVPSLSNDQDPIVRPVIRLPDRNIVLTRINPEIRDTSVLVRLRPAWEDLRSYLTARGRKRFEVYVCTMAERDYALEMWRLLDLEANLISTKQLPDRVVCVKSGSRKSLLNVFQGGICHPGMAMVIDDRLNVWDDCDQPRVHVVPAFNPYYAPQAEMAYPIPVLCVARNVACNVRGGFFKEFDENLLRRIFELRHEDEIMTLPCAPDVRNYLMSEDPGFVPNANKEVPVPEGMNGAEVERRLSQSESTSFASNNHNSRPEPSQQALIASFTPMPPLIPRPSVALQRPGLLGAAPREGESELQRRRLLILQHGQDLRSHSSSKDPPLMQQPPGHISAPAQRNGGWLADEEDTSTGQPNKRPELAQEPEVLPLEKPRGLNSLHHSSETSIHSNRLPSLPILKTEEAHHDNERYKQNHIPGVHSSSGDDGVPRGPLCNGGGKVSAQPFVASISVLQEIGLRCGFKVEFKAVVNTSKDPQFSVEVLFSGEKIGAGMGRTRKEAQSQAADNALHNLASKYVAYVGPDFISADDDLDKLPVERENGFLMDIPIASEPDEQSQKEVSQTLGASGQQGVLEDSEKLLAMVAGIEELGLSPVFDDHPPASLTLSQGEYYFQVKVDGKLVGKGVGSSKDGAKLQAAEDALRSLKSGTNQQMQKRISSPRPLQAGAAKRVKDEV